MGINIRKAEYFTQLTFPGLYNPRMAKRDEDDNILFPAWMCETVTEAHMGGGYTDEIPCADRAHYIVTYTAFEGHVDYDYENTERVCSEHFGQMVSYADAHPDEMEITHIVQTDMLREFPTRPVNLRKYGVPIF